MSQSNLDQYKTVQIQTSNPGELLIALFDGLFRFLLVAKHSMMQKKRAQAGEALSRAHAIVSELLTGLDRPHYPELCDNLSRVYEFCLSRITRANLKNDPAMVDEIMRVLTPIREAFGEAVKTAKAEEKTNAKR